MSFHFVVPGMGDHTWLEWIADALLWLGLLWLTVAAIVVILMLLAAVEEWRWWFSTVLPIVASGTVALVLAYVVSLVARRSN